MKKAGLDSEEKVKAAFEKQWANQKINGVQYLDVKLQVSTDGKVTWTVAGAEAYADGGKFIGLPYPEGADKADDFVIYHMYAEDMLGHKAGDIEVFEGDVISKSDDLLLLTVSGFSPFAVVWKDPPPVTPTPAPTAAPKTKPTETPVPAATATPAPTEKPAPTPTPVTDPDLKVPPTGDGTPITALYTAASVSAAGLVVLRPRRKKKR